MDHRAPPPPQQPELQMPSPVVPVRRRRRSQRSPRQQAAAIPVVVPPPAALSVPPASAPRQIPALPAAAGRDPDADADCYLMLLAHTAVSQADAEAEASSRPAPAPVPAPAGEERLRRRYSPLLAPATADEEKEKPYDAPRLLPLAVVDEAQSSSVSSSTGHQLGGGVSSPTAAAGAWPTPMQLDDDDEEELEPGEIPPEKQPAGEPSAEMSAEEGKRKKEVFVGGLSRDALEDDVRDALSAAGEVTQVRMFMDRMTGKNKGYCFVAYRDAAMASKAVAEFGDVKICGKQCRVAVPEGDKKPKIVQNPTIEYYNGIYEQRQPSSTLAAQSSYITSWGHHASYVAPPPVVAGYYYPMCIIMESCIGHHPADLNHHGLLGAGPSGRSQMGQSGSSRPAGQPHRSRN